MRGCAVKSAHLLLPGSSLRGFPGPDVSVAQGLAGRAAQEAEQVALPGSEGHVPSRTHMSGTPWVYSAQPRLLTAQRCKAESEAAGEREM